MKKALFVVLVATGCSSSQSGESVSELEQQADSVNDCCEIARASLGKENHLVKLGSRVVLVHDWVPRKGSPGEYSGFSMTVSNDASMSYLIKADGASFAGHATSYKTPDGTAIAKINFCSECDNPDGCDGGGGGGGGSDTPPGGGDGSGCYGGDCPGGGGGTTGPL